MHTSPTSTSDNAVARCSSPVLHEEDVREMREEASDGRTLLLDLAGVECVTAGGLGQLVALHTRLRESGGRLVLVNVGERAFEVFKLTGLNALLDVRLVGETRLPNALRSRVSHIKPVVGLAAVRGSQMAENAADLAGSQEGDRPLPVELSVVPVHLREGQNLARQVLRRFFGVLEGQFERKWNVQARVGGEELDAAAGVEDDDQDAVLLEGKQLLRPSAEERHSNVSSP
jgi:anti-anti-sigma factor